MPKDRSDLKILLIQVRQDVITRTEEYAEFVRYSGLRADQFILWDVFQQPYFPGDLADYDALFIGGSSDASVLKPIEYPFVLTIQDLIRQSLDQALPVFASCFGFQLAVAALGGQIIIDEAQQELGTYALQLTSAAHEDRLFHDVPDPFWVCVGHRERAVTLPDNFLVLGSTALCPYQAFTIPGRPFYGFQFHPEIDRNDLAARLRRYGNRYLAPTADLEQIIAQLQETPGANALIRKFIDRVVL